jgi:hypothetical protein
MRIEPLTCAHTNAYYAHMATLNLYVSDRLKERMTAHELNWSQIASAAIEAALNAAEKPPAAPSQGRVPAPLDAGRALYDHVVKALRAHKVNPADLAVSDMNNRLSTYTLSVGLAIDALEKRIANLEKAGKLAA